VQGCVHGRLRQQAPASARQSPTQLKGHAAGRVQASPYG
jgi:hypothetical protein